LRSAAGFFAGTNFPTMKALPLFLCLIAFVLPAAAKGVGAKEALRTLGRLRGASWLERVVQMSGDRGQDQPAAWHIIASDGKGGLREFFVNAKSVISEGPVPADVAAAVKGTAVASQKFVTNSTHAFMAAEGVAKKQKFGFDAMNFRLRCAAGTSTPVWTLDLLDANGAKLSEVTVSAVSGKVTRAVVFPQPAAATQPAQGGMQKAADVVNTGVKSVGRGFKRAGSWITDRFTPGPPAPPAVR
jgi:hypothetical protein